MFVTRNVFLKYQDADPGNTGGTGGTPPPSPPSLDALPAEHRATVQALIDAGVTSATAGLKANRDQLLAEIKPLKETAKKWEGFDPEVVHNILKKFADDDEAKLIKEGKIEEVLKNRTERMNQDWQRKLDAEKKGSEKLAERAKKLERRATNAEVIKGANEAGALPEAMEDIVLRAQNAGWTVNEEGDVVATKDGAVLYGKNGKDPLTPKEWAEDLRSIAPHLFQKAQGSGANGSGGGSGRAGAAIPAGLGPEARMTLAREQQSGVRH